MGNLFELLVLGLSLAAAVLSYHTYSSKHGSVKNIAVYVMIAAVATGVALLTDLAGVFNGDSVVAEVLDQSELVTAVMLLLITLEMAKHKK